MNVTIQSVKFDAADKLKEFIEQKVNKLDVFFDGIIDAEVILKLDKSESSENKVAEIGLKVPGSDLFAKKQTKSFEESIDLCCGALKKQLIKKKEKVK
ncbi:ribosome hibernation-promoting factor, HPF/YfiA family [Labilibacter marinus]|uniref:ribosome hibernation-promoting factor, HPF/YfiA family n=1 Tax=Labilibacter marinus TaxID=1477105 RepID=UPI0008338E80|nr:ribosome-associated translation inhibitor RaiA [Labilibacter marinus]